MTNPLMPEMVNHAQMPPGSFFFASSKLRQEVGILIDFPSCLGHRSLSSWNCRRIESSISNDTLLAIGGSYDNIFRVDEFEDLVGEMH